MVASRGARGAWLAAATLLITTVVWLAMTRSAPPQTGRNFFGAWRTVPILVAAGLLWAGGGAVLAASWRRAFFGYLFLSLLLLSSWAMLEVGTLLGIDYRALRESPEPIGSAPIPNQDVRGVTYPDTAHAWSLPAEPIPFHFRTDRRGFRNDLDRDEADVYLVGDSILVAGLLPFERTVTALLEAGLRRPVMSIALIGIGAQREFELLRGSALPLRGRLVLQFVTEANDLGDSRRFRRGSSRSSGSFADRSFSKLAVLWLQRLLQPVPYEAIHQSGWIGEQRYLFHWVGDAVTDCDAEIEPTLAALRAMHEHVQAAGGNHALVLVPSKYRVLRARCRWPPQSTLLDPARNLSPLLAALIAWAPTAGIAVLDLTPAFEAAADTGGIPYFADDTHPNAEGHRTMADALMAWPAMAESLRLR